MSVFPQYTRINIDGAVVAITGGARGIGRATAERFVAAGAAVAIGDLDLEVAQQTAEELGARCHAYKVDVGSRESFNAFIEAVTSDVGPVDILVNNAGIMPLGDFIDETPGVSATQIAVNLSGPINGMQAVLPAMVERGNGHVVNVASLAGRMPTPGAAVYSATKHAVVGLSLSVRDEVAPYGVSVTTVLPSLVRTDLGAGLDMPNVVTVDPEDIAKAVVDTVRTRRAEVIVPRWLGSAVNLTNTLPRSLQQAARTAAGGSRQAAGALNSAERTAYLKRVAGQVTDS